MSKDKPTKQEKLFTAILAKNRIARAIAEAKRTGEKDLLSFNVIIADLIAIEEVIGRLNQPGVQNIIDHNSQHDITFKI